jgi:Ala-tRNA(Pro) deacylase
MTLSICFVKKEKGNQMNKQEIYEYLKKEKIWHEITEHDAVYNMEDLFKITIPYPEYDAKNLFVRDDKRLNYYLITVKGDVRIDLKEFRKRNNTRPLSFASAQELMDILGLLPGAVGPLGLLNGQERKVYFFLDSFFAQKDALIGIHPNDNTATVWMKSEDLIRWIKSHGNPVYIL